MATQILYSGNYIIVCGHADKEEECRAITAMCDSLDRDDNFKTIAYDKGYALFERISGGDDMDFQALEAQLAALKEQVAGIKSCTCDLSLYLSKNEASLNYETKAAHEASIALLQEAIDKLNATIGYVDTSKGTVAEQISELNSAIILVQQLAEKAMEEAKKGQCTCDPSVLQKQIDTLNEGIVGWNDKLKVVNQTALKSVADGAALEALVKDNYATKEELAAGKKEAMDKAEEALKVAIEALEKASSEPSEKIGEIERKLDGFISEYQPKIDQLIFDVAMLQKKFATLQEKTEYKLPYTATELNTLLAKLENL